MGQSGGDSASDLIRRGCLTLFEFHDASTSRDGNWEKPVGTVRISWEVDEKLWKELKALAEESNQSISGLLTEAIREFVQRRRVRLAVRRHLEDSMKDNERLGRLLGE